jgi:hypothetical protein
VSKLVKKRRMGALRGTLWWSRERGEKRADAGDGGKSEP